MDDTVDNEPMNDRQRKLYAKLATEICRKITQGMKEHLTTLDIDISQPHTILKELDNEYKAKTPVEQNNIQKQFLKDEWDPKKQPDLKMYAKAKFDLQKLIPNLIAPQTLNQNMCSMLTNTMPPHFAEVCGRLRTSSEALTWYQVRDQLVDFDKSRSDEKQQVHGNVYAATGSETGVGKSMKQMADAITMLAKGKGKYGGGKGKGGKRFNGNCYKCGKPGHRQANCQSKGKGNTVIKQPFFNSKCLNCDRKGHFKKDCKWEGGGAYNKKWVDNMKKKGKKKNKN